MSLKLDAVAYRNRADYRLRRLEYLVAVDYMRAQDLTTPIEQKMQYFKYQEEISKEINESNTTNSEQT